MAALVPDQRFGDGDASASTVEVGAQSEGFPLARRMYNRAKYNEMKSRTSSGTGIYTVTLFIGDDQYLEPITTQDGKILRPCPTADKIPA